MVKKIVMATFLISAVAMGVEIKNGSGEGYSDDIKVAVSLEDNKIVAIEVLQNNDTPGISKPAIKELTKQIIETQTTKLDTIAGATYTSEGFLEAVHNALSEKN